MQLNELDISTKVIRNSSVIEERDVVICDCKLCLTVMKYEVICPEPASIPPSLMITGDIPPLYVSVTDDASQLTVNENVISFGGVQFEFLKDCKQIVVDGNTYDIGVPGDGMSLEFGDNELIGFTPAVHTGN